MLQSDKSSEEIGAHLGRSTASVEHKRYSLKMSPEKRKAQLDRLRRWRVMHGRSDRPMAGVDPTVFLRDPTPPATLEDWERRGALEPRDLTAAICGDPLPGYSALEEE